MNSCPHCGGTGVKAPEHDLYVLKNVRLTPMQGRIVRALMQRAPVISTNGTRHFASYPEILNWMYYDKDQPLTARGVLTVEYAKLKRKLPMVKFETVPRVGIAAYGLE